METVASTVQQLREYGVVRRGLSGVMVRPVDREMAEAMNLDRPVGALVNDVTEGGAAQRAGRAVRPDDGGAGGSGQNWPVPSGFRARQRGDCRVRRQAPQLQNCDARRVGPGTSGHLGASS